MTESLTTSVRTYVGPVTSSRFSLPASFNVSCVVNDARPMTTALTVSTVRRCAGPSHTTGAWTGTGVTGARTVTAADRGRCAIRPAICPCSGARKEKHKVRK